MIVDRHCTACGYRGSWSQSWVEFTTAHRDAHLAAFPDVDRHGLDLAVEYADRGQP